MQHKDLRPGMARRIAKLTPLISPICCPLHQPELGLTLALYVPPVFRTRCPHEQRFYRTDCAVHVSAIPSRCSSPCHGSSEYLQYRLGSFQYILHGPIHRLSPKYRRNSTSLCRAKGPKRTTKRLYHQTKPPFTDVKVRILAPVFSNKCHVTLRCARTGEQDAGCRRRWFPAFALPFSPPKGLFCYRQPR